MGRRADRPDLPPDLGRRRRGGVEAQPLGPDHLGRRRRPGLPVDARPRPRPRPLGPSASWSTGRRGPGAGDGRRPDQLPGLCGQRGRPAGRPDPRDAGGPAALDRRRRGGDAGSSWPTPRPRSAASPRRPWPGSRRGRRPGSSPSSWSASTTPTPGWSARPRPWPIARHAEPRPQQPAVTLVRWLYAHPQADPIAREGVIRALERLGEAGVEEVALAVRTRRGIEREAAVGWFAAFRSAEAAEQLTGLAKVPDLGPAERLSLVRQFRDIPVDVPLATGPLADWTWAHPEADPAVKLAALDACRLAGNPASSLIVALLDDDDEPVRMAATHAAARTRPPGSLARLAARLEKSGTSAAERLAVVRALRGSGPAAFGPLEAAYLGSDDFGFRRAALRSMAEANRAKAAARARRGPDGPRPRPQASRPPAILARPGPGSPSWHRRARRPGRPPRRARGAPEGGHARSPQAGGRDRGRGRPGRRRPRPRSRSGSKAEAEGDPWSGLGVFAREARSGARTATRPAGRRAPGAGRPRRPPARPRLVEALLKHPSRRRRPGAATDPAGARPTRRVPRAAWRLSGPRRTRRQPRCPAVELTPSELARRRRVPPEQAARDGLGPGGRAGRAGSSPSARSPRAPTSSGPRSTGSTRPAPCPARTALALWMALDSDRGGVFDLRGEFASEAGRAYVAFEVRSRPRPGRGPPVRARGGGPGLPQRGQGGRDPRPRRSTRPGFASTAPALTPAARPRPARRSRPGWNLVLVAIDRSGRGEPRASFEVAAPGPIELRCRG